MVESRGDRQLRPWKSMSLDDDDDDDDDDDTEHAAVSINIGFTAAFSTLIPSALYDHSYHQIKTFLRTEAHHCGRQC